MMEDIEKYRITVDELDRLIAAAMLKAKAISQDTVPIDTGNMRYASYKTEHIGQGAYRVYFNMDGKHEEGKLDGIAPYVRYTNERKNYRTYGWFDNKTVPTFLQAFVKSFAELLSLTGVEAEIELKDKQKDKQKEDEG